MTTRFASLELDTKPTPVAAPNPNAFKAVGTFDLGAGKTAFQDENGTWHNALGLQSTANMRNVAKVWQDQCIPLDAFYKSIKEEAKTKTDIVIPESDLRLDAACNLYDGSPFTERGFETLRTFTDIPVAMLRYLQEKNQLTDIAKYINSELDEREIAWAKCGKDARTFRVRKREDIVSKKEVNRAVVSQQYGVIDNDTALEMIIDALPKGSAKDALASHLYNNGDDIVGNILLPDYIKSYPDSDYGVALAFKNSETKRLKFSIDPMIFRAICLNGNIWGRMNSEINLDVKHFGKIDKAALREQVKLVIKNALALGWDFTDQMQLTKEVKVPNVRQLIASECRANQLTIKQGREIDRAYFIEIGEKSPEKTAFAVVNAFTRAAQQFNGDDRANMETVAGSLTTPSLKASKDAVAAHWSKRIDAAKKLSDEEVNKYVYVRI